MTTRAFAGLALFGVLLVMTGLSPEYAFAQAPFYPGKTVKIIAATARGGMGDNRV